MRVTVTGGGGFLGRYVVQALKDQGDEVYVARSADYDLRNRTDADLLVMDSEPEAIIHLAARVGGIGANVESPGRFIYENALMGLELMEQARLQGVGKFVTVGTACMYPADAPVPTLETDLWNGEPARETAAYAHAKRLIAAQGLAYHEQYDFNAVMVIPSNLYGPGDTSTHVVPQMIARFRQDDPVMLWGTGAATRDFLYVEDAADGIVAALNYYDEPEPVNIGSGVETPIWQLAAMVAKELGYEGPIRWDPTRPEGARRRLLSVRKAAARMGWYPTTGLSDGLKATLEEAS